MTAAPEGLSPKVDVRNLNSVRKALQSATFARLASSDPRVRTCNEFRHARSW